MNKKSAFLYLWTSTTDQQNSIENQEKDLIEYCKKTDIEVVDKFIDFGKSGENTYNRPEFKRMMALIENSEASPVDMILVTKLDRFARSMLDLLLKMEILVSKNIKLATLTNEFETRTAIGKMTFSILGVFAQFERDLIRERTREGYRAAIAKGTMCHRPKIDVDKKKVLSYIDKDISANATAKILEVTPNTIKSRLNEWGYHFDDNQNKWVQVV
jgi:DNA invertase Pin-like site-specific DNA recombinase